MARADRGKHASVAHLARRRPPGAGWAGAQLRENKRLRPSRGRLSVLVDLRHVPGGPNRSEHRNPAGEPNGGRRYLNGDGVVDAADWVKLGRIVVGLDSMLPGAAFMKADLAPKTTKGDGVVDAGDWVQLGRFVVGLDPLQSAGGPAAPIL